MSRSPRVLAVDWSGAIRHADRKIWLAEADSTGLVGLETGRDREEITAHLVAMRVQTPEIIVGLDFAFSFPAWFLTDTDTNSARALWQRSIQCESQWLSCAEPPFWGRGGTKRPVLKDHYRRTELEAPNVGGIRPKSVFQVFGAGAVGTGSIRGMALLARLSDAGFAVWPFDEPTLPLLVEIYPRLLTQAVRKSSHNDREAYLELRYPNLDSGLARLAASSEDAFDAAVSALVMCAHMESLLTLKRADDPIRQLEGEIWFPCP